TAALRHIWKPMIKIRQATAASKPKLVSLDATLKTPSSVYTISSEDPMTDSGSSFSGALFGAISWPVSRFRLAEGLLLEQQMFLPHDESAVAISWSLRGDTAINAQLVVKPFFSGCAARSYRDVGFHFDCEDNGGDSPGYQMCQGQECLPIPMASITTNQFGCSIAFASKRQLRLQREM